MTEKEKLSRDLRALELLGRAYIKVPRVAFNWLFSDDRSERLLGKVYCSLFILSNHTEGIVFVNKRRVPCGKGELIITYERLAWLTELSRSTVCRYIDILVEKSLVDVRRVEDRTCFRVCGYELFMESTMQPEKKGRGKFVRTKSDVPPDPADVARNMAREEFKISGGREPRLDLLM